MNRKVETIFTSKKAVIPAAILCTLLWGSAFPCVKTGYAMFSIESSDTFSILLFAGCRFFLAGLLTLCVSRILNRRLIQPDRSNLKGVLLLSLFQTFSSYFLYYISLAHLTGAKGAILNSTNIFFAVILSHFCFADDKVTLRKFIGCAVGFAGVILVNLSRGGLALSFTLSGEGFMILSAGLYAAGNVICKKLKGSMEPVSLNGWQLSIGGLLLILTGLAGGGRLRLTSPFGVLLLAYMVFISATAFTLWYLLITYHPVGSISIFNFLTPVFGTLLSGIFLHENVLTPANLTALICVCLGIFIVNLTAPKPAGPGGKL
ncbi:DMT family transporter [Lachnotalea sp. AF33-28]|uniref:DMT family transporter n=1 Tax=Lachnotalea sp. AF33-28 TaxID=2292046 RepID=UPI001314BA97|nr:DMT family transporter [Lachnotalea sp. AF33-28]